MWKAYSPPPCDEATKPPILNPVNGCPEPPIINHVPVASVVIGSPASPDGALSEVRSMKSQDTSGRSSSRKERASGAKARMVRMAMKVGIDKVGFKRQEWYSVMAAHRVEVKEEVRAGSTLQADDGIRVIYYDGIES